MRPPIKLQAAIALIVLLLTVKSHGGIDFRCGWQKLPRVSTAPPVRLNPGRRGFAPMAAMVAPPSTRPFLLEIETVEDFLSLARKVRSGGGEQEVVKVLYHRKAPGGPKLYYFNTKEFPYHGWFAEAHTGFHGTEEEFNRNYQGGGHDREYNQGTLVLSKGTGKNGANQLLLEVWTGDTIDAKHLVEFHDKVKQGLKKVEMPVVFHPLGVDQERLATTADFPIPMITTEELFQGKTYQPLNEGVAYGYVKIVDPHDRDPLLGVTDIAVFEQVPNDIGLVGGVVTGEFQTPLSHVNVKSINRGTVNMALKNARQELKKYAGKPIELKVEGNEYRIRVLPEHEAQRLITDFWSTRRPKAGEKPRFTIDPKFAGKLQDLSSAYRRTPSPQEHQALIRRVGAKAANLALIHYLIKTSTDLEGVTSPPTIAAHFGLYDEFMAMTVPGGRTTVAKKIELILNRERLLDPTRLHPIEKVRPALQEIRDLIQSSTVPDQMIRELKRAVFDDPTSPIHYTKNPILLLRSSTNSEDMVGFSGAGLYNSTALKLYDADANGKLTLRKWEDIETDFRQKIPYVYSSVWNERAFQEREWYSINGRQHLDIKAGIAIHGGFNGTVGEGKIGETANGVAITTNIYDPSDKSKIYLNGQHYGLSVTNPPSPEELARLGGNAGDRYLTEEILVTNFLASPEQNERPDAWKQWPYERRQSSSVNGRKPVFASDEETRRLAVYLQRVSDRMARVYGKNPNEFIADVEWNIFGKDRIISINQSRPFTPPKVAESP